MLKPRKKITGQQYLLNDIKNPVKEGLVKSRNLSKKKKYTPSTKHYVILEQQVHFLRTDLTH